MEWWLAGTWRRDRAEWCRRVDLEGALALLEEAVAGQRRVMGDEHPETLTAINNLGTLLSSQGNLAEAERMVRRVLVGHESTLGRDHPGTLVTASNLASVLQAQGNRGAQRRLVINGVEHAV